MRHRVRLSLLWERLLAALRLGSPAWRAFQLDLELLQAVQQLAEREQRPAEEVASELLSFALAQHHNTNGLLERWQSLSPREQQVAALACLNYTNRQIAARLNLSPETIKTHMRNLLYKFDLRSKAELRVALSEWDFSKWE